MRKFSKILENIQFEGRSTKIFDVIDDIIQNIEYSYQEKKDFYNQYLWEDIGDEYSDQYLEDLANGRMREFYKQDKIANYEELRDYLHNTYNFNLDTDTDGIYVDCMWLKYLINSMMSKTMKNINTK